MALRGAAVADGEELSAVASGARGAGGCGVGYELYVYGAD